MLLLFGKSLWYIPFWKQKKNSQLFKKQAESFLYVFPDNFFDWKNNRKMTECQEILLENNRKMTKCQKF